MKGMTSTLFCGPLGLLLVCKVHCTVLKPRAEGRARSLKCFCLPECTASRHKSAVRREEEEAVADKPQINKWSNGSERRYRDWVIRDSNLRRFGNTSRKLESFKCSC